MTRCAHHTVYEGQRFDCNLPLDHPGAHQAGIVYWFPDQPPHSCYEAS